MVHFCCYGIGEIDHPQKTSIFCYCIMTLPPNMKRGGGERRSIWARFSWVPKDLATQVQAGIAQKGKVFADACQEITPEGDVAWEFISPFFGQLEAPGYSSSSKTKIFLYLVLWIHY